MSALKNLASVKPKFQIYPKMILGFYLIVPFAILLTLVDFIFLHNRLRDFLPRTPEALFWFTVFFVSPHIAASGFAMFDRDYWPHYKWHFLLIVPAIFLLAYLGPLTIGITAFGVFYAFWTIKHVIVQQFAILPLFRCAPNGSFIVWKYLGVFLGFIMYAGLAPEDIHFEVRSFVLSAWAICALPFLLASISTAQKCETKLGKIYIWANFLLINSGLTMYATGYSFNAILMARIVHDCTAFYFYIIHDSNRNADSQPNLFYRALSFTKMPIFLLSPIAAILIMLPYSFQPVNSILLFLNPVLSMIHFYFESIMWKKDSPHRLHIQFANVE